MDSQSLSSSLDLVSSGGHTVSLEHRAALQTSMILLRKNYRFTRVLFWGKILGLKADYYIAQGKGEDQLADTKTLYSLNCMDWHLLPPATEQMVDQVVHAARGRFTGDPSYCYETQDTSRPAGGDAADDQEVTIKVKEEVRLAVTVHQIDAEVSVVPRGAFIQNAHGLVQTNRSFNGLSHTEAGKLHNFLHFTTPRNGKRKSIQQMADFNPSMDFLEPLSEDIPKGSWSVQWEQAGSVCVVRSLRWIGLTFYHVPCTPQHAYLYIGDGTLNLDLPFML